MLGKFNITGFVPNAEYYVSRCASEKEAQEVLAYLVRKGEISEGEGQSLLKGFKCNGGKKTEPFASKSFTVADLLDEQAAEKLKALESGSFKLAASDKLFEEINVKLYEALGFTAKIDPVNADHFLGNSVTEYDGVWGRLKAIEVADVSDNEVLLDGGCYKGFLSLTAGLLFKKLGRAVEIVGVDPLAEHTTICKDNAEAFGLENVRFQAAELTEAEFDSGVDVQIFYKSPAIGDAARAGSVCSYGDESKNVLDNTIAYLNEDGRIIIYDTEKSTIKFCNTYLKKQGFICSVSKLCDGLLLKAERD
jgi:precorrin-6B methylase 2